MTSADGRSAFGIEHIAKYSGAYGVNRVAIAAMEKDRQRRIKKIKASKKKSAFDVDHAIAKSFTRNAARLAGAAEKGSAYASQRLAAGQAGAKVTSNVNAIRAAQQAKGFGGATRRAKQAGQSASQSYVADKKVATKARRTAVKTLGRENTKVPGGIGRMESNAASAMNANQAAKPASMGWKVPTALAGAGAAAGGGYAYSQRRKTA